MISLITSSSWKTNWFEAPGVDWLGNHHAPVPSGERARGSFLATTASATLERPGWYRTSRSPESAAKPISALVTWSNPPGASRCAGKVYSRLVRPPNRAMTQPARSTFVGPQLISSSQKAEFVEEASSLNATFGGAASGNVCVATTSRPNTTSLVSGPATELVAKAALKWARISFVERARL